MANSKKAAAKTQTKNSFLPDNYEPPKSGGGDNYMKFEDGTNRFRAISKPIMGSLGWDHESKPRRFRMNETPDGDFREKPKHFWALVVWDYDLERPRILEITQQSIIRAIVELNNDSEWGAPWNYDLKVTKKGQKLETEYSVNPSPKKKISQAIRDAVSDWEIDLELLFDGDDPFVKIPDNVSTDMNPDNDNDPDNDTDDDLPFN